MTPRLRHWSTRTMDESPTLFKVGKRVVDDLYIHISAVDLSNAQNSGTPSNRRCVGYRRSRAERPTW